MRGFLSSGSWLSFSLSCITFLFFLCLYLSFFSLGSVLPLVLSYLFLGSSVLPFCTGVFFSYLVVSCASSLLLFLLQDEDLVASLLNLIRLEGDLHTVQYVLTILCEIVRGKAFLKQDKFSSSSSSLLSSSLSLPPLL